MKKQAIYCLWMIALLFSSCSSMKNSSSGMTKYYSQTPNLSSVIFEGGDGKSIENAIVIKNAKNELIGVASEYDFVAKKHGIRNKDWNASSQSTISKNGKTYDALDIVLLPDKVTVTYYFDISGFYGKF